jgi:formylglycine-generating enzyme required for sulfatase activity
VALADLPPLSPVAVASGAQISRDHGYEFVTVGAPGNAAYPGGLFGRNAGSGSVAEPFRIARTQVTNAQMAEFANAYLPFMQGDPGQQYGIVGIFIRFDYDINRYVVNPGSEQVAAAMSWRAAARYCNWLCNDRQSTAAAFETGAYDTSTFGDLPGRQFSDQLVHTQDARFYIPTRSQWVKAAYYDPNRSGPGQGGYWTYPNASDNELRYGFPWEGGESIAGAWRDIPPYSWELPVASYEGTQSPWGLFDLSGSSRDWNEDDDGNRGARLYSGSSRIEGVPFSTDSLYRSEAFPVYPNDGVNFAGLRIAATVPTPGGGVTMCVVLTMAALSRRRRLV